jgi:hypothetical protein
LPLAWLIVGFCLCRLFQDEPTVDHHEGKSAPAREHPEEQVRAEAFEESSEEEGKEEDEGVDMSSPLNSYVLLLDCILMTMGPDGRVIFQVVPRHGSLH